MKINRMTVHAHVMASKCINKSRKNFRSKQVNKLNAMPPFCHQSNENIGKLQTRKQVNQ